MNTEKRIEKVRQWEQELAESYNVPLSAVVWKGGNKFVVVLGEGKEVEI